MKLHVMRFSSQKDSTLGLLFDESNGKREFLCYTLEDEYRENKVMHETRIPAGTYDTSGCLLLGDTQTQNNVSDGFVGASTQAYKRVYPPIAKALKEGECVEITYSDFDSV